MKKSILLATIMFAIFFTNFFTTQLRAQEVNLGQAKQLAMFVKLNSDSMKMEGQAICYLLDYPENGFHVLSSWRDSLLTLEIYPTVVAHPWCVNFTCSAGSIFDGLYAVKFSSAVKAQKVERLNNMIALLNLVDVKTLGQQKIDQVKLKSELSLWAGKVRTYEQYLAIDSLPIWNDSFVFLDFEDEDMNNKGTLKIDFLGSISNKNLREILTVVKGK